MRMIGAKLDFPPLWFNSSRLAAERANMEHRMGEIKASQDSLAVEKAALGKNILCMPAIN